MINSKLQRQFIAFNKKISLSYSHDKILKQKSNLLINNLKIGLKQAFIHEKPLLRFEIFEQGSYYMKTGIRPLYGVDDYDIDVGVYFYFHRSRYDPLKFKNQIKKALEHHNRTTKSKRSCVQIQYHEAEGKAYHVDLAIYVHPMCNAGVTYLCKAPIRMQEHEWQISNPLKFRAIFDNRLGQAQKGDREQFLRIIRYLKAWKDFTFKSEGSNRPTGIALTVCAMNWFKVHQNGIEYDDLAALEYLIDYILDDYKKNNAFVIRMPVEPYNNLFEKMTPIQQATCMTELEKLASSLHQIRTMPNVIDACSELGNKFGSRFPQY